MNVDVNPLTVIGRDTVTESTPPASANAPVCVLASETVIAPVELIVTVKSPLVETVGLPIVNWLAPGVEEVV